jgi:hypothetical protein
VNDFFGLLGLLLPGELAPDLLELLVADLSGLAHSGSMLFAFAKIKIRSLGQYCDHYCHDNFRQFSEKKNVFFFLTSQCYDRNFAQFSFVLRQFLRHFLRKYF